MGLGNITSTILSKYKADTSQHKKAIKGLSKEEAKRHKLVLAQTEKQNKKIDGQIAMFAKLGVGLVAVGAAVKVLGAGLDTLQHNAALNAATVGVSIEGLRKSTVGLVDDTRLLEFASKAMNGTFKLSQAEMEQALTGALALRKTLGVDLVTALDKTQRAISEGSTEPLKKLGLVIKGPNNNTAAGLQDALRALSAQAEQVGGNLHVAGDEAKKAGVDIENAMDRMSEAAGRLATGLAPLASVVADLANGLNAIIAGASGAIGAMADWASDASSVHIDENGNITPGRQLIKKKFSAESFDRINDALDQKFLAGIQARRAESNAKFKAGLGQLGDTFGAGVSSITGLGSGFAGGGAKRSPQKKGGGGPVDYSVSVVEPMWKIKEREDMNAAILQVIAKGEASDAGRARSAATAADGESALAGLRGAKIDGSVHTELLASIEKAQQMQVQAQLSENQNLLSSIFGAPAEIDATALALGNLAGTFDSFTGAFGSGVDALITGSGSFADAFQSAIAESLRSMAIDMSIKALMHGAQALGSLAYYDFGGAAKHGAAAAAYGAGAVAAGVGARLMGAGATSTPSIGGAGAEGVGQSQGRQEQERDKTNIFIIGDDYAGLSSRERGSRFRQITREAGIQVNGDVVVDG